MTMYTGGYFFRGHSVSTVCVFMAERTKTWTKKCKILKWTKTSFCSGSFSCNTFQARLPEKNFRPASAFTLFCADVQMLHHHQTYRSLNSWLLPLFMCLCHRLPDVILSGMGSRQFSRGRGRGREVEAEARQGSNVLNRGEARQRQRQRARGRGEAH